MQNTTKIENQNIQDSEANAIIENQSDEPQAAKQAQTLNIIEPSTGEAEQTPLQNNPLQLNAANFQAQLTTPLSAQDANAIGALDETELDYTPLAISRLPIIQREAETANETASEDTITSQPNLIVNPAPLAAPIIDITLSNATTNQTVINDADHYKIIQETIGDTRKLFGDEMDIQTVADTTRVDYTFASADSFKAVLKSDWNTLKNIEVNSDSLNEVTLTNFVHTDVALTGNDDATVIITDAKRGNIETNDGNDTITVKALTNGAGWSNTFDIDSGAGNDTIIVRGSNGHTIAEIMAGEGDDTVELRGDYETSTTDLGAGQDIFKGGNSDDTVHGGAGDDNIRGGQGNDVLYGSDTLIAEASINQIRYDFEFIKSQAGYKNTVGFYKVASDGTIEDVQIVFQNLKALSAGDTQSYIEAAHSASVELFIIANGYNLNNEYQDLVLNSENLDFIYNQGQSDERTAKITDPADSVTLVYNDGVQELALNGNMFHAIQDLNIDGQDHTQETVIDNVTEIAFEDLLNLGDQDFTDAVVTFEETPLYDFNYGVIGSDNDTLNGNNGNDLIFGGAGNDTINGGQDTDIAVFSGAINDYIITKNGNTYTIEDTIDGRDGTDTIKDVEGILFGLEALYPSQISTDSDLADILENYDPIQDAIDTFVNNANLGQIESVTIDSDLPSLTIFTTQDALVQSQILIA